jgi:UDP-glucose 4-epimerase
MRCLVLGASGYFGRHLVAQLTSAHEVVITIPGGGDSERIDLTRAESFRATDWSVDCVYVLAGATGTHASFTEYRRFVECNELILLNVLEAIRSSAHRPRVVFPSSRLVYRGSAQPLTEESPLEARTVYAAGKIACEQYLQAYHHAHEIPHCILRICVPYGNTCSSAYSFGTIGAFIKQAVTVGRIGLYGDGSLRRTFTHIEDVCRVLIAAGSHAALRNGTFNVPGEDLSLRTAAELIAGFAGATVEQGAWPDADLKIESGSTVFDASRLLGVIPSVLRTDFAGWASSLNLANRH